MSEDKSFIHICSSEDMHPYNCDGKGKCIHCDGGCEAIWPGCLLCAYSVPEIDEAAEKLAEDIEKEIRNPLVKNI